MSAKKKKVNPRHIPVSRATMNRELHAAVDAFVAVAMYAALDCGFDAGQLNQFYDKLQSTCNSINRGFVSVRGITETVKSEYAEILKQVDSKYGLDF